MSGSAGITGMSSTGRGWTPAYAAQVPVGPAAGDYQMPNQYQFPLQLGQQEPGSGVLAPKGPQYDPFGYEDLKKPLAQLALGMAQRSLQPRGQAMPPPVHNMGLAPLGTPVRNPYAL